MRAIITRNSNVINGSVDIDVKFEEDDDGPYIRVSYEMLHKMNLIPRNDGYMKIGDKTFVLARNRPTTNFWAWLIEANAQPMTELLRDDGYL